MQAFALGIACRFALHVKPDSRGIYIAEDFFVILSVSLLFEHFWFEPRATSNVQPCAFIAANYVLLGRLARYLGSGKHLLVSPNRITITFVISDITTFLIQVGESGRFPVHKNNGLHQTPGNRRGCLCGCKYNERRKTWFPRAYWRTSIIPSIRTSFAPRYSSAL